MPIFISLKRTTAQFLALTLCIGTSALFLSSCENKKTIQALDGQTDKSNKGGKPSGKPTLGLPAYSPRDFVKGQTWIWRARNSIPQKRYCQRWQVVAVTDDGMTTLEHRQSQTCETYENSSWRRYLVNMNTGEILRITYSDDTSTSHPNSSIFPRINGDDSPQATDRRELTFNQQKYQVVQAKGSKSWYFDAAQTPLHAVLFQDDKWELIFASF